MLLALALGLALLCVARLMMGSTFGWPDSTVLDFRAHRLLTAVSAGVALAVAGALLQALLRNPLASPYIIGVSSGAALGVVIAITGAGAVLGWGGRSACAFLTAMLTLSVLYLLSQRRGWIDPLGLLLVGVILNAINGAIIMLVQTLIPANLGKSLLLWMFGALNENLSWPWLWILASVILVVSMVAVMMGRSIDLATFPDSEAQALGLHLGRMRLMLFALAGLLTAVAVQLVGPLGFVGLIGPHAVRLILGPRHTPLLIGSALAGAALVVAGDLAVKLIYHLTQQRALLPVGVLMAIIGGPIFLVMLRRQLGRGALS